MEDLNTPDLRVSVPITMRNPTKSNIKQIMSIKEPSLLWARKKKTYVESLLIMVLTLDVFEFSVVLGLLGSKAPHKT